MMSSERDIFLSHRSVDKDFVRKLASDIESEYWQGRKLLTWLDEAVGGSIPGHIERGLQNSRFVALIMTPAYFESPSAGLMRNGTPRCIRTPITEGID
jgi:hypothetical protein